MSLPAPGTPWPPPELGKVAQHAREAAVWWRGDPAALDAYYRTHARTAPSLAQRARDAYRAFWGRPVGTAAQPVRKLHLPIPGGIVRMSATELFSDPWVFRTPTATTPAPGVPAGEGEAPATPALIVSNPVQDRADQILNSPQHHAALLAAAEATSALGGGYARVVFDPDTVDHAWIDYVDADHAFAEFRWGRTVAVTFWTELDNVDNQLVTRHLERHERGRIVHALYQGTGSNLGRRIPLTEHPATAGLKVLTDRDGLTYVDTGVPDALTADYVPNVTPNPDWRHDPTARHLGRSDLSPDVIPIFHEIDAVASGLTRDFRIAQARMVASRSVLQSAGFGGGLHLDDAQELFTEVGEGIGKDGSMQSLFEFHQPTIRVTEHAQGWEVLAREALRKIGYSPITFGIPDEVAQTATEATGKARQSLITTQGKARLWSGMLAPLATTCLRVDAAKFGRPAPTEQLELDLPEFAAIGDEAKARVVQSWDVAGAASTRTKVAYLHPDWDDTRVDTEVEAIDQAGQVPAAGFDGFP